MPFVLLYLGRSVMYIQSNYNSVNMYGSEKKPGFWKRIKQKVLDTLPEATFNDGAKNLKKWRNIDEFISRPAENRFIMGATAMLTQPAIDYCNHKVDEETRETSRIRTVSKIVAGTIVGIAVRGSCYKLVEKMTNISGKSRLEKALLPSKYLESLVKNMKLLKNYRSALSTGLAIMTMCVTNFLIDAPLTVFLTNYQLAKRKDKLQHLKGGVKNE